MKTLSRIFNTFLHPAGGAWKSWLLIVCILMPLSCSAQRNALNHISSTERGDGKGHVIRFHLRQATRSIDFSQPAAYLLQLELKGPGIDSTDVSLNDRSKIIRKIDYYAIPGGIGADIFLTKESLYRGAAYPDRDSDDILLGLTRTNRSDLSSHVQAMKPFPWSAASLASVSLAAAPQPDGNGAEVDSSYQRVRDKIKFDVVVLDPGHGAHDVGTHHNGVYEKNIVLDIAKKVGGYIQKYLPEVRVVYTRDDDTFVELEERGSIANRAEGDLFVSIHANAAPSAPSAHGTETYFLGLERSQSALETMKRENSVINLENGDGRKELTQEDLVIYELANSGYIASSEALAGMVQNQFKNRAQRRSRGVKQARFVVLYHASMPAILIETGFVSNPSEARYLTSDYGQSIIASAIFRAIRNYKEDFEKSQHLSTN